MIERHDYALRNQMYKDHGSKQINYWFVAFSNVRLISVYIHV